MGLGLSDAEVEIADRQRSPTHRSRGDGGFAPGRVKARCATGLDPSSPVLGKGCASGTGPDASKQEARSAQRSISRSFFRSLSACSRSNRSLAR